MTSKKSMMNVKKMSTKSKHNGKKSGNSPIQAKGIFCYLFKDSWQPNQKKSKVKSKTSMLSRPVSSKLSVKSNPLNLLNFLLIRKSHS